MPKLNKKMKLASHKTSMHLKTYHLKIFVFNTGEHNVKCQAISSIWKTFGFKSKKSFPAHFETCQ